MMPIVDAQMRFYLLSHIATRLTTGSPLLNECPGLTAEQTRRLRDLSAQEFLWLAGFRDLRIEVRVDGPTLQRALHVIPMIGEAEWLKSYFLRHGASWQLIRDLFKVRRKLVLRLRREIGAWCPPGRLQLPDDRTRESVCSAWREIAETDRRLRYYRLHQRFPMYLIRVLEEVVREERIAP